MQNTRRPLYIFLHIPKCAGTTIRRHIEENFALRERIPVYFGEVLPGIGGKAPISFQSHTDVEGYVRSLTDAEKEDLQIIYGHNVPYGLHTLFDREVRYVTLLRNPLERLVSYYNYNREYIKRAPNSSAHTAKRFKNALDDIEEDGIPLSFTEWIRARTWNHNSMRAFLLRRGFLLNDEEENMHALRRFYFVGIVRACSVDVPFLYHLLGIKYFFQRENISTQYTTREEVNSVKTLFITANKRDYELYRAALILNRAFKLRHPFFYVRAVHTLLKRLHEKNFVLGALYKLSHTLRVRSEFYGKALDALKAHI